MSLLRRALGPLQRRLETTVHPLRYLFLEITQRCNLRCLHCGSDCSSRPHPDELSTEEWLSFFEYLGQRAPTEKMALVLTGGEPLCHPELDRLLEGLRTNGLTWGMVTNGQALTEARLRALLDGGLASATVSLDGLEGSHDWLRGVPGAFRHATAAIERLAGAGLPFFDVVTCVNPRNLGELPQLLELLRRLGVPAWRLFSIFPRGRAQGSGELLLSPQGFRELLGFIAAERQRIDRAAFKLSFSCEGYLPEAVDCAVRDEPYFCRAGISIGSVLCDGSISACPNIPRTLVQGNIRSDDLMAVWEERFQPFRDRGWMRTGACEGCAEWSRCLGNSLHLWDEQGNETACCSYRLAGGAG